MPNFEVRVSSFNDSREWFSEFRAGIDRLTLSGRPVPALGGLPRTGQLQFTALPAVQRGYGGFASIVGRPVQLRLSQPGRPGGCRLTGQVTTTRPGPSGTSEVNFVYQTITWD